MHFRFKNAALNAEWNAIEKSMEDYKFLVNMGKATQKDFIKKFSPLYDKYKLLKTEESQSQTINNIGVYLNKHVSLHTHIVVKGVK